MANVSQVTNDYFQGNFNSSTRIIFLAEGYRAADEPQFYRDVEKIMSALGSIFPLNLCFVNNKKISCYYQFSPSQNFGYANTSSGIQNRTVFESYVTSNQLHINPNKLNAHVDNLVYTEDGRNTNINRTVPKGLNYEIENLPLIQTTTLLVILLPQANQSYVEAEVTDPETYYCIATSVDNFCEQVVLRALCKVLQLGDEFDMPGTGNQNPSSFQGESIQFLYPNLLYHANLTTGINPSTDPLFKWRGLFGSNSNSNIPLHSHPNPASTNRTLPQYSVTYEDIELWEGGAGFRKDVFRSAQDCLLRRKIADPSLPVKVKPVSFCPVCRNPAVVFKGQAIRYTKKQES